MSKTGSLKYAKQILLFIVLTGLLTVHATAAPSIELFPGAKNPGIQATAAILVRSDTGELLFGQNIHERRAPASVTKLMTVWLGAEYGHYDDMVTVTEEDFYNITSDGTSANLQIGETIRFEDLLYCALLVSANEACNVIARHVAGSAEAFLTLVNERLRELGCEDSYFASTHGLPNDAHYTSAYDLYLILQACMTSPAFTEIASTIEYYSEPTNLTPEGRTLKTGNHLISSLRQGDKYYYPYAICGKTGYTKAAGLCLAAAAEKDGIPLISVVLNAQTEQADTIASFAETIRLFNWGYTTFQDRLIIARGEFLDELTLEDGSTIHLVARDDVHAFLPAQPVELELEYSLMDNLAAPMTEGDILGMADIVYDGRLLGTTGVLSGSTVAAALMDGLPALAPSEVRYTADFAAITAQVTDPALIPSLTLRDVTDITALPKPSGFGRVLGRIWSLIAIAALLGLWRMFARTLRQSRPPRLVWAICVLLAAVNIVSNVLNPAAQEPKGRLHLAVEVGVEPNADCVLTIPISVMAGQSLRVLYYDGTEVPFTYDGLRLNAEVSSGGVYCVQLIEEI